MEEGRKGGSVSRSYILLLDSEALQSRSFRFCIIFLLSASLSAQKYCYIT